MITGRNCSGPFPFSFLLVPAAACNAHQPGRRRPQLPQNTSCMGPLSNPHLSQVQAVAIIDIIIITSDPAEVILTSGSMTPGDLDS